MTYDLEGKERDRVSTGGSAGSLSRLSRGQLATIVGSNRLAFLGYHVVEQVDAVAGSINGRAARPKRMRHGGTAVVLNPPASIKGTV